jgi:D-alanyl-D-alanine carboxypeptidase
MACLVGLTTRTEMAAAAGRTIIGMPRTLQSGFSIVAWGLVLAVAAAPTGRGTAGAPITLRHLSQRIVAAGAPGALVAVRDARRTRAAAAGYADLVPKRPMRADDRFRIGSVTKTFLATVVLQLAREGRLALDDPLERWLPGLVPDGRAIKIRHLLSHRSGIYSYTEDGRFVARLRTGSGNGWVPRELIGLATSHKPLFEPGTRWSYSNTNYVLIGMIAEAVTGRKIDEEVRRRIIAPLGLRHTDLPATSALPVPYARGYLSDGSELRRSSGAHPPDATDLGVAWARPAGAMTSTAGDLARFYAALLGGKLLRRDLLAAMEKTVDTHEGQGERYGLGLASARVHCGSVWGHIGVFPGYTTLILSSRHGRRQVVAMANTSSDLSPSADVTPTMARAAEDAYCLARSPGSARVKQAAHGSD